MNTLHVKLTTRKELNNKDTAEGQKNYSSAFKRFEAGFQKLNAARVRALRERGQKLKAQLKQKFCSPSAHDKLEELKSFEQGL
jgi:hypothetical protein